MKFPYMSFLFMVGFIASLICFQISHEDVHIAINDNFLWDSQVNYDLLIPTSVTQIPKNNSIYSNEMALTHSMNEVVGYQIIWILGVLGGGILTICLILECKDE